MGSARHTSTPVELATTEILTFHGRNRNGAHTIGQTTDSPLEFVRGKFDARWQELELFDHHDPDQLLGQIYQDEGQRRWWADSGMGRWSDVERGLPVRRLPALWGSG